MAVRDKRSVSRSLFVPGSRKFWGLKTDQARLLYLAILVGADDEGRLEGSDADVQAILPRCKWSLAQFGQYIGNIRRSGLIARYKVKGHHYIQVTNFSEHQSWQGLSRDPSRIPIPDGTISASTATSGSEQAQQENASTASAPENGRTNPERKPLWKKGKPSNPNPAGVGKLLSHISESVKEKTTTGDPQETWKEMRSKYRRKVGKSLGAWKPKGGQFMGLLEKNGYDMVMRGFELWLENSTKSWLRTVGWPFAMFISQAPDFIEEAEDERDSPAADGEVRPEDDPGHVSDEGKRILEQARKL